MNRCPYCGVGLPPLESPLSCAACRRPLPIPEDASPFEIFGLDFGYAVDTKDLRRRLLRTSREIHPDFFGTAAPELRALAEKNSALLNTAHELLSDDAARADWLVKHLGGPDEGAERAMPVAFLTEVLEWNELLEEARSSEGFDARLDALETTLRTKRDASMSMLQALLVPLPARGAPNLKRARQELNAVRYVDRALSEIEALRLSKAGAR
jgi:DnaJ-domain-containing protein 1